MNDPLPKKLHFLIKLIQSVVYEEAFANIPETFLSAVLKKAALSIKNSKSFLVILSIYESVSEA